jgi:hypothetical protein
MWRWTPGISAPPPAKPGTGELLGVAVAADVIDAAVVLLATDGNDMVTLNRDDFENLTAATGRHVELIRP